MIHVHNNIPASPLRSFIRTITLLLPFIDALASLNLLKFAQCPCPHLNHFILTHTHPLELCHISQVRYYLALDVLIQGHHWHRHRYHERHHRSLVSPFASTERRLCSQSSIRIPRRHPRDSSL